MSNDLSTVSSLPVSNFDPKRLAEQATNFLGRLQLVTKGKYVDQGLVKPGHYAIPTSDDDAIDLGPEVAILVLAVRDKALDTNEKPPVTDFDANSDLYKQIVEQAGKPNSGCMFGPSFLVYEGSQGRFLEFFCGNASGRQEAGKLATFLPISEEQAKQFGQGFSAQGPQFATLSAKYIKRPKYSWHAPVVGKCSTPFETVPTVEDVVKEINKFLNPEVAQDVEVAEETKGRSR